MNRLGEMTYSKDLIDRVLYHYYNNDYSIKELTNLFCITTKTIYNWRQKYDSSTYLNKKSHYIKKSADIRTTRKKYNCMLTPEIETYINDYINKNQLIQPKKFRKHLQKRFNVSFCLDTLYSWFKKLNITHKKVNRKKIFVCKKKEKLLKELHQKINNVKQKENIISIDECHFELHMKPAKGWNKKGKKIYKRSYNKTRKGVSLLMAINNNKVIGYVIVEKAVNAQIFTDFINTIDNDNNVYLMDNARTHHSKILKEYMKDKKSNIIYNVPYNPETNPIEHVFSTLKYEIVNHVTNNIQNLKKSIGKVINKVNSDHLKNYYRYSLNI